MGDATHTVRIDAKSWRVVILPTPKGLTRGAAIGFCGGSAVGRVENPRIGVSACWWPNETPTLLEFGDKKNLSVGRARGNFIPGHWREEDSGVMHAIGWELQDGKLIQHDLDRKTYLSSWATASSGEGFIGIGTPLSEPEKRATSRGLVWHKSSLVAEVSADYDVTLSAGKGVCVAGNVRGRAMLWPSPNEAAIELSPKGMMMSEVHSIDGDTQIGSAFKGMRARAGLWQGSAATFSDLTPTGYQTGVAYGGDGGFQVGYVRAKEMTRNGTPGSDNRATLWAGDANQWIDLNALLPHTKYNASIAWAIEVSGDAIRICGQADYVQTENPGSDRESHVVPTSHPVLWTAKFA